MLPSEERGPGASPPVHTTNGEQAKRSAFKKFTYRGIDLDALLDMSNSEFAAIITSRQRRRLTRRGLQRKHGALTTKLRNAVREAFLSLALCVGTCCKSGSAVSDPVCRSVMCPRVRSPL